MKWRLLAVAVCLPGIAHPAAACFTPESQTALIHSAPPSPVPRGAIVLDVDIRMEGSDSLYDQGLTARVRDVVHGDFPGDEVTLRAFGETSCDAPFANGTSGLIVGYLSEDRAGRIFSPVFVRRGDGFRLRSGQDTP